MRVSLALSFLLDALRPPPTRCRVGSRWAVPTTISILPQSLPSESLVCLLGLSDSWPYAPDSPSASGLRVRAASYSQNHHFLPTFLGLGGFEACMKAPFLFHSAQAFLLYHGPCGQPVDRTIIHPGSPVKTSGRHPLLLNNDQI